MKKIIKSSIGSAILAVLLSACAGTSATVAVRERPVEPVFVRPAEPYRGAIFIPGEWMWRGHRYVYIPPHYVRPHRDRIWIDGYWDSTPRGFVWRPGYWR